MASRLSSLRWRWEADNRLIQTLQGGPKHTEGALTKSSPIRRFPSFHRLGSDATVFSTRFTRLCHQGHPTSRKYSGGEPGAATLCLVAQSSRTVSFRYLAYSTHFRQVLSTFKHLTNEAIGLEPNPMLLPGEQSIYTIWWFHKGDPILVSEKHHSTCTGSLEHCH
jgi:hypothetical protein